jgi:DNA-binding beta-propeller fold protein YncE
MRTSARRLFAGYAALLAALPAASHAEVPAEAPPPVLRAAARGGAVVIDHAALVAYAADADNAALHRIDLLSGRVVTTALRCAPEQVALLGDGRVAVALRACNRVEVIDLDALGEGTVVASVEVAAEPVGLAVTPRGEILVTSAWGHALTALDGETLATRFTLDLGREPRSVTVTGDGRRAFVTHAVGDTVTSVDLFPAEGAEGPAAHPVRALGGRYRNRVDGAVGAGTLHPSASLAFASVMNEEGTRLFVPHLAVQNGTEAVRVVSGGYGGVAVEEDTSVASVAVLSVQDEQVLGAAGSTGRARPAPAPIPAQAKATGEVAQQQADALQDILGQLDNNAMPQGTAMAMASPAPQAPVHISINPFSNTSVAPAGSPSRQATAAAVLGDALYVTSYGTGELVELDARSLDPAMATRRAFAVGDGPAGVDVDPATRTAVVWNQFSHDLAIVSLASGEVERIPVAGDPLPRDVAAGRRLFFSELDHSVSRDGRACASCHPDGRDDGLVWKLGGGPRQTPTLVGRLERGPYGWLGKHTTLEGNMNETMSRLGGTGMSAPHLAELAAYMRRGLLTPQRSAPSVHDAALADRGKELFESEAVGCGGCHVLGEGTSDHKPHDVGSHAKDDSDKAFRTPPLLFLANTAPYFHDGRYATLEAVLDDNLDRMGSTTQLSANDRGALLAFLRTL